MQSFEIAAKLLEVAGLIADAEDLDARDKNALIGDLRRLTMSLRGAAGLPGFRQAAFVPTTPGGVKPGA